jgi:hypothetical protein
MIPPGRSGLRLLSPAFASAAVAATLAVAFVPACYSAGDGTAPPPNQIYFPIGLVVSKSGGVLYIANSDFDLQWNGGTVQSYDLTQIRRDALQTIKDPAALATPFPGHPYGKLTRPSPQPGACPDNPPVTRDDGTSGRQPLGETCSPPVDATLYVKDSATIGAFATDMRLSCTQAYLQPSKWPTDPATKAIQYPCTRSRLYIPVRGDASLTWADVVPDEDPTFTPSPSATADEYPPFKLDCGVRVGGRCDGGHHAGNNPFEPNNSRNVTMPGEPFGMAESEDGTSVAVTHQTDSKVSLLATGFDKSKPGPPQTTPSLQFVLDGLPFGGNGIAAIPHDLEAFPAAPPGQPSNQPNDAFLLTTRSAAEIDLLRFYPDQGAGTGGAPTSSSLYRPFLAKEAVFSLTANAGSTDSRGIVIDPTPRIRCKLALPATLTPAERQQGEMQCARRPARVYIANRSPATLIVGEIGEPSTDGTNTYDADRLVIYQNIPLTLGPSRVYLAPIVDASGRLSLRVFVVCFDSAAIFIYDPEAGVVENIIRTGVGPYAMAFDPFDLEAAARGDVVNDDVRLGSMDPDLTAKRYRFAYVASFTQSYVQMLDLDNSRISKETFERVVFTLGPPTAPKGT